MSDLELRVLRLKKIVTAGLLAGTLLSIRLWIGQRDFPLVPVFVAFPAVPALLQTMLFAGFAGLLGISFFSSKPRKAIFVALLFATLFAITDQMRWQPWFYQYCFLLAALGAFSWKSDDISGQNKLLNTSRLVLACVYVYAGLQKMNFGFFGSIFPWMVGPFMRLIPSGVYLYPPLLGFAVPFVEMAIGLSLLTKRFRRIGVIASVGMTVFILFVLGPLGRNWNSVVWPWNVAMALLAAVLFWKADDFSWKDVFWMKGAWMQRAALVLFGILPALSFFNLWDSYLSAALYSGNVNAGKIYVSDSVKRRLSGSVLSYVSVTPNKGNELRYYDWSFGELNVPPYPETRVFKAIAGDICKLAEKPDDVTLEVAGKPTWFNRERPTSYDCSSFRSFGE